MEVVMVRVRRIGAATATAALSWLLFMLVLVLVLLVKCGEGSVSNYYRVGYYGGAAAGKVTEKQNDDGVGIEEEGSTRVKVQHRYYDYHDDYTKKVLLFNESITSKVMGFVLEDVKKVEGIRVKMMLNKLVQPSQVDTRILSGTSIGTGNYILEVGLGTPTKTLRVVIDTGSDLGWTQCKPCSGANSCYSQREPIFDPSGSSSYKSVPCDARLCKTVASTTTSGCTSTDICEYGIQYLDGSFTLGNVATDTLKVGSAQIPSYAFGCGLNNQGLFNGFDGLLGFSRNALAFPAQTRSRVFTYCLPSPFSTTATGFLEFGRTAAARGRSATPAVQFLPSNSAPFYEVSLSSLRVNSRSVIGPSGGGSLIIDSGTVITRLDSAIYFQVRDAFRRGTTKLPPAPSDAGQGLFDTCYKLKVGSTVTIPSVTFALGNAGLLFTPPATSLLYPMDDTGTVCFAFAPIKSGTASSILGNYQQQGFSFSFDIAHNSLSIKPNAC